MLVSANETSSFSHMNARAGIIPAALAILAFSVLTMGSADAQTFQADAVEILDMPGNLVVEIISGTSIEIEISGAAIATNRVDLHDRGVSSVGCGVSSVGL